MAEKEPVKKRGRGAANSEGPGSSAADPSPADDWGGMHSCQQAVTFDLCIKKGVGFAAFAISCLLISFHSILKCATAKPIAPLDNLTLCFAKSSALQGFSFCWQRLVGSWKGLLARAETLLRGLDVCLPQYMPDRSAERQAVKYNFKS